MRDCIVRVNTSKGNVKVNIAKMSLGSLLALRKECMGDPVITIIDYHFYALVGEVRSNRKRVHLKRFREGNSIHIRGGERYVKY